MRDVEDFLAALPGMGVRSEQIDVYKTHLTWASASLAKVGRGELSESGIPMLLEVARKEGAGEARLRNLETACVTYVRWRGMRGAGPPRATSPTSAASAAPSVPERRGVPTAAVVGLILGSVLMVGLVLLRPSRPAKEAAASAQPAEVHQASDAAPADPEPEAPNDCAALRRCCDGKADSMFCAVATKGNPSQCRQAMASMKELGIVDCRVKRE